MAGLNTIFACMQSNIRQTSLPAVLTLTNVGGGGRAPSAPLVPMPIYSTCICTLYIALPSQYITPTCTLLTLRLLHLWLSCLKDAWVTETPERSSFLSLLQYIPVIRYIFISQVCLIANVIVEKMLTTAREMWQAGFKVTCNHVL